MFPRTRLGALDACMDREDCGARHAVLETGPGGLPQGVGAGRKALVQRPDSPSVGEDLLAREFERRPRHGSIRKKVSASVVGVGAPGRTRTADAHLRTVPLYPLSYGGAACIVPRPRRGSPSGRSTPRGSCGGTRRGVERPSPRMPSDMASTPPLPDLILYSRPGCDLCDETRAVVQGLLEDRAARSQPLARLREVDISADADLERQLLHFIPVLELRSDRLPLATSPARIRRFLANHLDPVTACAATT